MKIVARYNGICEKCGLKVRAGTEIEWSKGRGSTHIECPEKVAGPPVVPSGEVAPYRLAGGSGYGCSGWQNGQVVRAHVGADGKLISAKTAGAQEIWLFVLKATKKYVREDGLSFGVGDDSGHLFGAECRLATPEEAAPAIARRNAREKKHAAKRDLSGLLAEITANGEFPEGPLAVKGKTLYTQDARLQAYGGGSWLIDEGGYLWYVKNNGADGDAWSANNVTTGGAGAMGWRLRWTDVLRGRVEVILAVLGEKEEEKDV